MTREHLVRVGVDIPESLHKGLKLLALDEGKTLKALIAEILNDVTPISRKKKG